MEKAKRAIDPELSAMATCERVLKDLSNDAKTRTLNWLGDRFRLPEVVRESQVELTTVTMPVSALPPGLKEVLARTAPLAPAPSVPCEEANGQPA